MCKWSSLSALTKKYPAARRRRLQTGLSVHTQRGVMAAVSFFLRIAFGFKFMISPVLVKAEVKWGQTAIGAMFASAPKPSENLRGRATSGKASTGPVAG